MEATVLVVDDQSASRRALVLELEDAGFRVLEAQDGVEGWGMFHDRKPDLVVSDIRMPRSDGVDLTARIREVSNVPVVLFTAYGSMDTGVAALKAGASECLSSRDLDPGELVVLLRRLLEGTPSVDRIRKEHDASERNRIVEALRTTGGNVKQAAELLGRSRPSLYYAMERLGIRVRS